LLVRGLTIDQPPRTVGTRGDHLVLTFRQGGETIRVIAWKRGEWADRLSRGQTVHAALQPKLKTWQNRTRVEAVLEDIASP